MFDSLSCGCYPSRGITCQVHSPVLVYPPLVTAPAMPIPRHPESVGRRRCGIPEHRRQIKSMQKWVAHLQTSQSEMWTRLRAADLEIEKLRLELWKEQRLRADMASSLPVDDRR